MKKFSLRSRIIPNIVHQIRNSSSNKTASNGPQKTTNEAEDVEIEQKYDSKDVTKEDMQWRTPWHKKEGQYFSVLRTFYKEDSKRSMLQVLQMPIDLSPSNVRKWLEEKKEYKEIVMQSYIPERHQILGSELATAHFIVYRGGAVKFHGDDKWIKANEYNEYSLPSRYVEGKYLEAIDCTDMNLYYEGLVNMRDLKKLNGLASMGVSIWMTGVSTKSVIFSAIVWCI
ncbi:hypothetical protein NQ318_004461 [Aromia moschata]|uniref:Uncharacterized protein n=1 Tax=Aromia moschata TaxID=1265417 RepID=A0AAV8YD79_9CUCU|nr:hypothetical protein NQ318_004461 [Aromia moschata]